MHCPTCTLKGIKSPEKVINFDKPYPGIARITFTCGHYRSFSTLPNYDYDWEVI